MIQLPRFAPNSLEITQSKIERSLFRHSPIEDWALGQATLLIDELGGIDFDSVGRAYAYSPSSIRNVIDDSFRAAIRRIDEFLCIDVERSMAACSYRIDRTSDTDEKPEIAFSFETGKVPSGYAVEGLMQLDQNTHDAVLAAMELVASVGIAPFTPVDCVHFAGSLELEAFEVLMEDLPAHLKHADAITIQSEYAAELEAFEYGAELGLDDPDEDIEVLIGSVCERFVAWRDFPSHSFRDYKSSHILAKAPRFHINRVRKLAEELDHNGARQFVASVLSSLERLLEFAGGDRGWKQYRYSERTLNCLVSLEDSSPVEGSFLLMFGEEGSFWNDQVRGYYSYVMQTNEPPLLRVNSMCSESRRVAKIAYARFVISEQIYSQLADFSSSLLEDSGTESATVDADLLAA